MNTPFYRSNTEIMVTGDGLSAAIARQLLKSEEKKQKGTIANGNHHILLRAESAELLSKIYGVRAEDLPGKKVKQKHIKWGTASFHTSPSDGLLVNTSKLFEYFNSGNLNKYSQARNYDYEDACSAFTVTSIKNRHEFVIGNRYIFAGKITAIAPDSKSESIWISSVPNGWIFISPTETQNEWLVQRCVLGESVVQEEQIYLEALSILAAKKTDQQLSLSKINTPITWNPFCWHNNNIYIGTAAVSYDPICGDGVGKAIKNVYWAVASLNQCDFRNEALIKDLSSIYQLKVAESFWSHLCSSYQFYKQILKPIDLNKQFPEILIEKCHSIVQEFRSNLKGYSLALDAVTPNNPKIHYQCNQPNSILL